MKNSAHPLLYQVNTRVWLARISQELGQPVTLNEIPDSELDAIAGLGFDWVYFLGVWQTGQAGGELSRSNAEWLAEYRTILPDLTEADICGSPFAVTGYTAHTALGGDQALDRLHQRLNQRGLRLMLDFVPNHTAPDHPWVFDHPEYYVNRTEDHLKAEPQNYTLLPTSQGPSILARGRDPYFPGWPDTVQLNYGNAELQLAQQKELLKIAGLCDGLRCDMAMLVLPEIFQRTWDIPAAPFWPAVIPMVREKVPGFTFMAEVYWDLEPVLLDQGFDYAYDKRLYDRLRAQEAASVSEHLQTSSSHLGQLAHFLENHDEIPRCGCFSSTCSPGRSDHNLSRTRLTFLPPGAVRRFPNQDFRAPVPWPPRNHRPCLTWFLRAPAGEPPDGRFTRRPMAALTGIASLGAQPHARRLYRQRLAGAIRQAFARCGELLTASQPGLCAAAFLGVRQGIGKTGRSDEFNSL